MTRILYTWIYVYVCIYIYMCVLYMYISLYIYILYNHSASNQTSESTFKTFGHLDMMALLHSHPQRLAQSWPWSEWQLCRTYPQSPHAKRHGRIDSHSLHYDCDTLTHWWMWLSSSGMKHEAHWELFFQWEASIALNHPTSHHENAGLRIICRKMHDQIAQTWEGWPRMASAVCRCLFRHPSKVLPSHTSRCSGKFVAHPSRYCASAGCPDGYGHGHETMTSDGCKPAKGRREPCSPSERCTCQCRLDAKEFQGSVLQCAAILAWLTSWIKLDLIPTMSLSFR